MNKRGLLSLLVISIFLILSINFVFAQSSSNDTEDRLDNAYQCVKDRVDDDCSKLTSDEQAAALLSLGNYKDCKESFFENSKDGECWPKSSCKLKETSIALLALEESGASSSETNKILSWLLNQTKTVADLTWYLEIDANEATTCSINYDSTNINVNILGNKKIGSIGGSCFTVSENGYWLKISSNCLEKEFTISCDKDFSTTLLYRTSDSQTIHVSQNIQSSVNGGELTEKVIYKCFKEGTVCNYEGSLWASLALTKKNQDISIYLPYLDSFAEDNSEKFPEAFLYIATGSEEYLQSILQDNFKGKFWQVSVNGRFYDTALAFLSLQGQNLEQVDATKDYLLDGKTQNSQGCWNNVKDTGLLLYSGWSTSSSSERPECNSDSDCELDKRCLGGLCRSGSDDRDCETFGNSCEPRISCLDSGGSVLEDYIGCSGATICCSVEVQDISCQEQSGFLCDFDEECPLSGTIMQSSDSSICCSTQCVLKPTQERSACDQAGYICKTSCNDGESESSLTCESQSQICCTPKSSTGSSGSSWWIWILLILIILVIVAIIFRNRIKMFIFKRKSGVGKGPAPRETRPPFFPPASPSRHPGNMFGRPVFPRPSHPTQRQFRPGAGSSNPDKDKEFNETLRKLKEMSK